MTGWQNVFVTDGIFGVLDDGLIASETADWSNGLAAPMSEGALITTGINTGHVRITAITQDAAPVHDAQGQWEEIVEVSVHAPAGALRIESMELGPVATEPALLSPAGPGWYRLRVHARGRQTLFDKVCLEPVEDYLVITWPAAKEDPTVIAASERILRALRTQQASITSPPTFSADLNPPVRKPSY